MHGAESAGSLKIFLRILFSGYCTIKTLNMQTHNSRQSSDMMTRATEVLKTRFGYQDFRLEQERILNAIFRGEDLLAIMPTGGGKSLCYQIPAILSKGLTVVISPLISLMKDQVDALRLLDVEASFLNSTLDTAGYARVMDSLRSGSTRLLYIAPERLFSQDGQFLDFLMSLNVTLFAIDEAHCISQWGHDFRPEYLKLSILKEHFPDVPVAAFTATADAQTRGDILQKLRLHSPKTFIASFDRANIHYRVEPKSQSYSQLTSFLKKRRDESGIIYCLSRQSVETLCEKLKDDGFSALPYHAGLKKETRDRNQDLFIKDEVKIMGATIAFGMGINKSNVRYVVHMDMPKNIEGYYQETGRAGRDGLKSDALLFYSSGDYAKLAKFAEVDGNPQQTQIMLAKLSRMSRFCELTACRRKHLLEYFGETYESPCGSCDNCTKVVQREDQSALAKTVINAVQTLGRGFGVTTLADFLKGAASGKYAAYHSDLPGYGALKELTKDMIKRRIREMIEMGILKQEGLEYPVVRLAPRAGEILRNEDQALLSVLETRAEKAVKEKAPARERLADMDYDADCFEELRRVRKELAGKENVPAYLILSDKSLIELSARKPRTPEELRGIYGFGAVKLSKYGQIFLDALKSA
jgi:ATP-dependent DNA helicase RecQ